MVYHLSHYLNVKKKLVLIKNKKSFDDFILDIDLNGDKFQIQTFKIILEKSKPKTKLEKCWNAYIYLAFCSKNTVNTTLDEFNLHISWCCGWWTHLNLQLVQIYVLVGMLTKWCLIRSNQRVITENGWLVVRIVCWMTYMVCSVDCCSNSVRWSTKQISSSHSKKQLLF